MTDRTGRVNHLFRLARAAYDDDRFAAAAELLAAVLRHHTDNGYAWFLYGDALRELGLWAEAERALGRAMTLCPGQPWPQVRLAMVKHQLGDHDGAERDYAAAAGHAEVAAAGWFWVDRATNLTATGQFAAAERCYRTAVSHADVAVEAWLGIGRVLRALGRYHAAAAAFDTAMQLDPASDEAVAAARSVVGVAAAVRLAAATR